VGLGLALPATRNRHLTYRSFSEGSNAARGTLLLAGALSMGVAAAQDNTTTSSQTTAKHDMKDAGQSTKNATKDTGAAAKVKDRTASQQ
jgi:hypothetical protein